MAEYLDNPAGRLLALIREAKQRPDPGNALVGWTGVFGLPATTNNDVQVEVVMRLLAVHHLINDLEKAINAIENEDDRKPFLGPLPRLRNAVPVANALNASFHGLLGNVSDSDLVILDFCSRHLHKSVAEPEVDSTSLSELANDVEELFNSVESSESMDPELRTFLLKQIETVRRGVQEYRIGGIDRLRETLGEILGTAIINQEILERNRESQELQRFINAASKLMSLITFASKATKAIEAVSSVLPLLLSGHSG
jgi:hypothetical protein